MAILAFAPGLRYRERKFTTPDGAAGPFLPGALLGVFPTARFRTILDIRGGLCCYKQHARCYFSTVITLGTPQPR